MLKKISPASILRLAGTLGSIALLIYLLQKQGWHEILGTFSRIPWWSALIGFLLMMGSRVATAARWHVLLRALGIDIPLRRSTSITFAGLFAANFLPSTVGGDVARLAAAIQLKYSGSKAAASLILDRLVGMFGMLFALPFGIPAVKEMLGNRAILHGSSASFLPVMSGVAPQGKARSLFGKIRGAVWRTLQALTEAARRPGELLAAVCFTWIHMVCTFGIISLLLHVMGSDLPFLTIAGLWTLVYFVTLIPVSINGLGLQELSITYVFTHSGVPATAAVAMALVFRTLTMLASVPGAAFVPAIMAGMRSETTPAES